MKGLHVLFSCDRMMTRGFVILLMHCLVHERSFVTLSGKESMGSLSFYCQR